MKCKRMLKLLALLVPLILLSVIGAMLTREPPLEPPQMQGVPMNLMIGGYLENDADFLQALPGEEDSVCGSSCPDLPCTYPPFDGAVYVDTALRRNGQICVRVSNGTMAPIQYGLPGSGRTDLRLERHIRAGRWHVRHANVLFTMPFIYPWMQSLAAESFLYEHMHHDYRRLPSGRYRVCFRFWQGNLVQEHEECSTPFSLPP